MITRMMMMMMMIIIIIIIIIKIIIINLCFIQLSVTHNALAVNIFFSVF